MVQLHSHAAFFVDRLYENFMQESGATPVI